MVSGERPLILCDVLRRWPTLKAAQRARRATLETFFRDHHVRSAAVIDTRIHALKAAMPLTTDAGVIAPHALLVQTLVSQLRVALHAIEDFDTAIAQRAQNHPTFPSSRPFQGPDLSSLPASWLPVASNAHALLPPQHSNHRPGSHP